MSNSQKLPASGIKDQYIAAKERWARKMADEHTAELEKLTPPELFRFVRKHGLSLVYERRPLQNSAEVFADFPSEREPAFPVSQVRLAGFVSKPSYRGFGINE
jgi:hypothetical protein